MAIDTSKVGKLATTIARVANFKSEYLTKGATTISQDQVSGKRVGKTFGFIVDRFNSYEFGGDTAIQDGLSTDMVDLTIHQYGHKIDAKQVEAALCLDMRGPWVKQNGVSVAKAATEGVFIEDMLKGCEIVEEASDAATAKKINIAAAELNEDYGKVYGFMGANPKMALVGQYKETGLTVDGKAGRAFTIGDISEGYVISLPRNAVGATLGAAIEASNKIGDSVTLSGAEKGKWYVFKKASNGVVAVMATSTTAGKIVATNGKAVDNSTAAETDGFYPVALRAENAFAFVDCSSLLANCTRSEDAEGLKIALGNVGGSGFTEEMDFGCAIAAGVADKKASKILLVKC